MFIKVGVDQQTVTNDNNEATQQQQHLIQNSRKMTDGRIINRNKFLYGPGPLGRRATGLGAKPPLQGLIICACQGLAVGLAGGFFYNVALGNPLVNSIENYYKENPTR